MQKDLPPDRRVTVTTNVPMVDGSIIVGSALFWRQPDGEVAGAVAPQLEDGTPHLTATQMVSALRALAETIELEELLG